MVRKAATLQSLASALRLANPGRGRLERGWRYLRPGRAEGTMVVAKTGLAVAVQAQHLAGGTTARAPGDEVTIRSPAGALNASPGYYVAHSETEMPYDEPLTRYYLNVAPEGAPSLLHHLCRALNAGRFAFDLKIATNLSAYHRADVAVLYLPRVQAQAARPIVGEVSLATGAMRPAVPAFTCQLASGVSSADDPGRGESFGLHRCRIIAEALVSRALAGRASGVEVICAAFAREGLAAERPYLAHAVDDIYASLDR